MRLVVVARAMSSHREVVTFDDMPNGPSHPQPGEIAMIGNADLGLEDVLKPRRR
jgi:hypothetical protein